MPAPTSTMKIALCFPGCHRRGGVERILLETACFLANRGHDVHLFANEIDSSATGRVQFHPVTVRRFPRFLRPLSFHRNATQQLVPSQFDAVGTFGCECPFGGLLWVQSVHRAWLQRSRQFRSATSIARWRQRLNPIHPVLLHLERRHFADRNYAKVAVTTDAVRTDLRQLYNVPTEDVAIVTNGFSPTEFNPQRRSQLRDQMRSKLGLSQDDIALLFVANELDRKGYGTILAAMRQLDRPNLKLVAIGRPDRNEVQARANAAGVGKQVIAYGPSDDVGAFHAAADLFVLPTQYEAFCLAILESLGSGLPVITSDIAGARDAIVPGINGDIISDPLNGQELADKLKSAIDQREQWSAAAPQTVEKYQWPSVLQSYETLLTDVAGHRNSTH